MTRKRALAAVALLLGGLLAALAPALSASAATPYCGITWGSLTKSAGSMTQTPLLTTRTGQSDCWDRVVFEFEGAANGYEVQYGEAYTEGQGLALSPYTAGGALLHVRLLQPAYSADYSYVYPYKAGDHVANVVGYQTLRDVVYGGSFEGQTTFAVGVRAKLPMRVFVLSGPGTHSRIVLDIAHYW